MTLQQTQNKITELEFWLENNPNHPDRTTIETDLRKLKEEQIGRSHERDTFDLREHNFYNV
jgi:regulator of sirC expression with transglutaminase-like and TPR domain